MAFGSKEVIRMTNLLSRATLAYIRGLSPQAAAHLEAAGDMTPAPTRHAPRRAVIDNRRQLIVMQNGRSEPAGEEVIEGEWTELD